MAQLTPKFVREGNEILAFFEDKLIAHGTNFSKVESTALDYLETLDKDRKNSEGARKKSIATHIVTPNGLKGEILSNTEGIWGEREITARFDNGRIVKFQVHGGNDEGLQYTSEEKSQQGSALEYLEGVLNEQIEGGKESLSKRIAKLDEVVVKVGSVIQSGVGAADERKLNNFALAAEHEKLEIKEALAHLEQSDAEAFAPPAPFQMKVAEQADLGHSGDGNWLDETVEEMIAESEGQDFDKLLEEEPGQFTAGLETGVLADTGSTREMALSHIMAKTAGLKGSTIDSYREQFLAKVEMARRAELSARKDTAHKEAAAQESTDFPDEALFS